MANYYEILGLEPMATASEIKAAFRKLAMIYHPDKNPDNREYFSTILKAYETLIEPATRRTYDYRLSHNLPQTEKTVKKHEGKNWRFDEKEMKRRKYYDEHIRKYAKKTDRADKTQELSKKPYNEFKYVLIATPIAALLFLLVASYASKDNSDRVFAGGNIKLTDTISVKPLNGETPYASHFGSGVYDIYSGKSLQITNESGNDAIVCLFGKSGFLRGFFMQKNFSATVRQLPNEKITVRYVCGQHFNRDLRTETFNLAGAFSNNISFFKTVNPILLNVTSQLKLQKENSEQFKTSNEKEFFDKTNEL